MRQNPLPLALGILFFLSGCQKEEVKHYRLAKDSNVPPPAAAQTQAQALPPGHPPVSGAPAQVAPGGPVGQEASSDLAWTAPAAWEAKPLGQMRKGSYALKGADGQEADLSVFVFPGTAGGLVDNINRWRGQLGLAPQDEATMTRENVRLKTEAGFDFVLVDMVNEKKERILGAVLEQKSVSWFFKLRGPDSLLETEKPAFIQFLQSVRNSRS